MFSSVGVTGCIPPDNSRLCLRLKREHTISRAVAPRAPRPDGVKAILMTKGAIAQPVVVYPYAAPEKVPMSQEYSVSLFFHYGTKVLSPDTVLVYGAPVLETADDEEGAA